MAHRFALLRGEDDHAKIRLFRDISLRGADLVRAFKADLI